MKVVTAIVPLCKTPVNGEIVEECRECVKRAVGKEDGGKLNDSLLKRGSNIIAFNMTNVSNGGDIIYDTTRLEAE